MLSLVAKRSEVKNRVRQMADELTDFVGRSRPCRPKSEGNLLLISNIIHLVVIFYIKINYICSVCPEKVDIGCRK